MVRQHVEAQYALRRTRPGLDRFSKRVDSSSYASAVLADADGLAQRP